jgi:hypothetical protein
MWRWEGSQFETSLGKKLERPPPTSQPIKKLGVVACACHPSYKGSINRKIVVQAGLGINLRPYLKNI